MLEHKASLVAQTVKNLPAVLETRVDPGLQKIPLEREVATHPVFLPGESCGQRSLLCYLPQGGKNSLQN